MQGEIFGYKTPKNVSEILEGNLKNMAETGRKSIKIIKTKNKV